MLVSGRSESASETSAENVTEASVNRFTTVGLIQMFCTRWLAQIGLLRPLLQVSVS